MDTPMIGMLLYHKHQFIPVDRTLEIYFCGCHQNCPGCHNPELQSQEYGIWRSPETIMDELKDYPEITKSVHILGGEPLEQDHEVLRVFLELLNQNGFQNIILFTGSILSVSEIRFNRLFQYVSFVKIGDFDETRLNTEKIPDPLTGLILASINQKCIRGWI